MGELATLISDVDRAVELGTHPFRTRALARITDLLIDKEAVLRDEQLHVLDGVIGRFTPLIDVSGRAGLATKLSTLSKAPPNVVRALAFDDEVTVAGPILARSRQIEDQDLIAIAAEKGTSHMLAICKRPRIAETVTDVLVSLGDSHVHHAVAGNVGARFSEQGTAALIENARDDETLQVSLGERHDLSATASQKLVEIARESARRRILDSLTPVPIEEPAPPAPSRDTAPVRSSVSGRNFAAGFAALDVITAKRPLVEGDLTSFATEGHDTATICALTRLTGIAVPVAEHVFDNRDGDLLLLVSKAHRWSWTTLRAMLLLRDQDAALSPRLKQAETRYAAVTAAKARRTLQVLQLRGSPGERSSNGRPPSLRLV